MVGPMHETIPIIDVSGLCSPDLEQREQVARELGSACRGIGFFYVTGHDISEHTLQDVFAASRAFFQLHPEEKNALSIRNSSFFQGYLAIAEEQLDLADAPDQKEAFNIGLELALDDPRLYEMFRGPNLWPPIAGWRDIMLSFYQACWKLGRDLHRGFSLDLGLDERFFENKIDHPLATLRLLHYPGLASGASAADGPGAGEHTDYGNITILAVDDVGGLELRTRDGRWIDAPQVAGAFICNVGDCLMRWTNDVYVSTPHRVAVPARDRYSLAFFLDPNPEAPVVPVLGGEAAVLRYPLISGRDYLLSRLEPTHVAA